MRKGFTLVEMLVVIVIISLLAMASVKMIGTARTAGHASRCQGNLKALWQGAMNCASETDSGDLPYAGSYDFYWQRTQTHHCRNGWVCWVPNGSPDPKYYKLPADKADRIACIRQESGSVKGKEKTESHSLYYPVVGGAANAANDEQAENSIRYSYFFDHVYQDMSIYCCPTYRSVVSGAKRSYVMNEWFGSRRNPIWEPRHLHRLSDSVQASRILLFTEMPFTSGSKTGERGGGTPYRWNEGSNRGENHGEVDKDNGLAQDSCFDCYIDKQKPRELYGAIHRKNGKDWAHAIFLDGHVESLCSTDPKNPSDKNYQTDTSKKIASGKW